MLGAEKCQGHKGNGYDHMDDNVFPSQYKKSNNTCVPAQSLPFMDTSKCRPYFKTENGYCSKILGRRLVFGSLANQKEKETRLVDFAMAKATLKLLQNFEISKTCIRAVDDIYCNHYFPGCDNTSATLLPRPVCREACEVLVLRYCKTEWLKAKELNKELSSLPVRNQVKHFDLINCTELPRLEGGKIPECYYPKRFMEALPETTEGKRLTTESCFYGDGQSYRGNMSETLSDFTCQSWSSQCPHRHHRTPDNFPELKNAGNACWNPGGQAPHGPWCYTTNRRVRWEYCPVEECDQHAKYRK
ncbi:hypothetical protein ACROYT_G013093 [Oculina patagonica]